MWNAKKTILFVASLVVVIFVSMKMANAEEQKTYTPKETIQAFAEVPSKVGNWFTGEVEKTKAYQTKVWSEAKNKWPWNMLKSKKNATQD